MTNAYGNDVSAWNDKNDTPQMIDFEKMKAHGTDFVYLRSTYGDWNDPDFKRNWQAAKDAGLLRGAYHYHLFLDDPVPQMNSFLDAFEGDYGELPPAFDVERLGIKTADRKTTLSVIWACMEIIKQRTGKAPIFYSNVDVIKNFLPDLNNKIPKWLLDYDLWIANYGVTKPNTGAWRTWKFWQFTDREDGRAHGVESKQIDANWYNGSLSDMQMYYGLKRKSAMYLLRETYNRIWERREIRDGGK
jgi:lysozyme